MEDIADIRKEVDGLRKKSRENLDALKKLKDELLADTALEEIAFDDDDKGTIYSVKKGGCKGYPLLKNEHIAVQRSIMIPNTELEVHRHEGVEYLVCYEGDIKIVNKDQDGEVVEVEIGKGGIIAVTPNTQHIATSKTGCRLVAITIPADKGYPDER